jgi:putative transcriptional regulator
MSKQAFDKIKAGIEGAIAIARGEADRATYRVHVPEEIDVRAIRKKLGMSQARFAASFGFGPDAVQNWEQGRHRPEGAASPFLKVISASRKRCAARWRPDPHCRRPSAFRIVSDTVIARSSITRRDPPARAPAPGFMSTLGS